MSKYAELPWSVEDTIENLKAIKDSMKKRVISLNLHGRGEKHAEEIEFDFGRAIEALDKQIPKKPKTKALGCDIEWWCPNCRANHILMNAKKCFEYCHHCGQRLEW